jgi:hypothetical protein
MSLVATLAALVPRATLALEHKSRSYFADARDFGMVIIRLGELLKPDPQGCDARTTRF